MPAAVARALLAAWLYLALPRGVVCELRVHWPLGRAEKKAPRLAVGFPGNLRQAPSHAYRCASEQPPAAPLLRRGASPAPAPGARGPPHVPFDLVLATPSSEVPIGVQKDHYVVRAAKAFEGAWVVAHTATRRLHAGWAVEFRMDTGVGREVRCIVRGRGLSFAEWPALPAPPRAIPAGEQACLEATAGDRVWLLFCRASADGGAELRVYRARHGADLVMWDARSYDSVATLRRDDWDSGGAAAPS